MNCEVGISMICYLLLLLTTVLYCDDVYGGRRFTGGAAGIWQVTPYPSNL